MYFGSYAASVDSLRALRKIDPFEFEYCPVLGKFCALNSSIVQRWGRFTFGFDSCRTLRPFDPFGSERWATERSARLLKGIFGGRSCRS